jgi:WD40 repeat protein
VICELVITGSADKTGKIIDLVKGFKQVGTLKASEAIFDIDLVYNLTVAGLGDGNVMVYDNDTCECLYGLGFH